METISPPLTFFCGRCWPELMKMSRMSGVVFHLDP